MVEKYYNEKGEVAVLYSPDFGAGWYTWNTDLENSKELLFDKTLVEYVLEKDYEKAANYAVGRWPVIYTGGLFQLEVMFLPEGTAFQVTEYDGCEDIEICEHVDWIVA